MTVQLPTATGCFSTAPDGLPLSLFPSVPLHEQSTPKLPLHPCRHPVRPRLPGRLRTVGLSPGPRPRIPRRPGRPPLDPRPADPGHPRHDHRPQRRAAGGIHRSRVDLVQPQGNGRPPRRGAAPGRRPAPPRGGAAGPAPGQPEQALPLPRARPVADRGQRGDGPGHNGGTPDQGIQAFLPQFRADRAVDRPGQHRRPRPGRHRTGLQRLAERQGRGTRGGDQPARLAGQQHQGAEDAQGQPGRGPEHRPATTVHRLQGAGKGRAQVRRALRLGGPGEPEERADPGDGQLPLLQPEQPRQLRPGLHAQPHPHRYLRAGLGDQAVQHVGGAGLRQVRREQSSQRGTGLDDHRRAHHPRRRPARRTDHDRGADQLLEHRHEQGRPADRTQADPRTARPGRFRRAAVAGLPRREPGLPAVPREMVEHRHRQHVVRLQPGGEHRRAGPGLLGVRQRRQAGAAQPAPRQPAEPGATGDGPADRTAHPGDAANRGGRRAGTRRS